MLLEQRMQKSHMSAQYDLGFAFNDQTTINWWIQK